MAGNPNTHVVFGSSPDSYFIGYGRRYSYANMPESFTKHIQTQMNISMTLWISMNKMLTSWITHNTATGNFHFTRNTNEIIQHHLSATNGKFPAEFVSFPDSDDPIHYFVKGKDSHLWTATLPDGLFQTLTKTMSEVPTFDAAITGMLFGKGKTHIYMFRGGFWPEYDDDVDAEHPLRKVLAKYSKGWCIDRASSLCFYDSRYYFLKFKQPGSTQLQITWNLPETMGTHLGELMGHMNDPEEQLGLHPSHCSSNRTDHGLREYSIATVRPEMDQRRKCKNSTCTHLSDVDIV
ncbi:hypothetical protein B0H14DRAFT_2522302 [Mycena olivaceomarginata]|nr:hypothetical protein B0H14DRAFT_2522302 [Mycena olivaceomarginata]